MIQLWNLVALVSSTAVARVLPPLESSSPVQLSGYDYVVVGSGPGGGPVAARLALAGHSVLVIEAGGDNGGDVVPMVPGLQLQATEYTPTKWDFYVNHFPTLEEQTLDSKMTWRNPSGDIYVGNNPPTGSDPLGILYPRAGTLGGCAGHNALIAIYPFRSDWSNFVGVTGDDSWDPDNMRKYFERLEKCEYLPNSITGHGFNGWLETRVADLELGIEDPKVLSMIVAAATALGKGVGKVITSVTGLAEFLLRDMNSDKPWRDTNENLFQVPTSVTHEFKRSTPRDFLLGVANAVDSDGSPKYKLDIMLHTLVTNVRFDTAGSKPKAVGVDFIQGESLYGADPRFNSADSGIKGSVDSHREVIVAGGTFNSPQILKLSGVGPKDELEKFDIPVVVDSPGVGTNLQDHYETTVVAEASSNFSLIEDCTFYRTPDDPCLERWRDSPLKGPYGSNGLPISILKRSSVVEGDTDLIISGAPGNFRGYFPGYSFNTTADAKHWVWLIEKLHPRNRAGNVTLRSKDPRDTPVINFNYFDSGDTANGAADKDLQAMYEAMLYARKIFHNVNPLAGTFDEVWPGPTMDSEDEMKQFIKHEAWSHHASCTCPIGADDDPNAVLDTKFRVRGVDGLRVVDASVFPKIPGSFTALSTYMISEKAADVIMEDL